MNTDSPLMLQLADTMVSGREIALTVSGFEIRGQVSLDGGHLHLGGREGTVTATRLVINNATVMGHGVRLGGQQLEAMNVVVSWGATDLRIQATSVQIGALQLIGDQEPLDGTIVLEGIVLAHLAVNGSEVQIAQLRVGSTKADVAIPVREHGAATPATEPSPIVAKLHGILDRLGGHVKVDLGLDLTVPVIGRRRATHKFRIPIDGGTINYRQLEDNLSALEDSLLDFSVRDEGLVLEVGIPLLPTRGKGKPIVTWVLDAADFALANEQRVRLSVLTHPTMNGKDRDEPEGEDGEKSPVAVRNARAAGLDVKLAIAPAEGELIRSVGDLALTGDVTYDADEAPEGVLRGTAENVELGGFDAGRAQLAGARLEAATAIEIEFAGVTPTRAKLVARGIELDRLHVAPSETPAASIGGDHPRAHHARVK